MKPIFLIALIAFAYLGCAHLPLIESQPQLVRDCTLLGVVSETANADNLSTALAANAMVRRVKEKALQLGATHIVWLHKTKSAAAAQAYHCTEP